MKGILIIVKGNFFSINVYFSLYLKVTIFFFINFLFLKISRMFIFKVINLYLSVKGDCRLKYESGVEEKNEKWKNIEKCLNNFYGWKLVKGGL